MLATGTTALVIRSLISRHTPSCIFQTHSLRYFCLFEQSLWGKHVIHCLKWQTRMCVFLEILIQLAGFVYGLGHNTAAYCYGEQKVCPVLGNPTQQLFVKLSNPNKHKLSCSGRENSSLSTLLKPVTGFTSQIKGVVFAASHATTHGNLKREWIQEIEKRKCD